MSRVATQSLWALADQGAASAANLLAGLLLARSIGREEYGTYALAWACLLVLNNIQTVLITRPLMVLGPGREAGEFRAYAGALARLQAMAGAVMALATMAAGAWRREPAWMALGVALWFVQAQDFCRAVLFTKMRADLAARNNLTFGACYLGLVGGLWILAPVGWRSATGVFLAMAVAAAAALLMGLRQVLPHLARSGEAGRHWRENWEFARWGLGTLAGESLLRQGNIVAAAAFGGVASAAVMEAARLILAPLQLVLFAGGRVVTPQAAERLHAGGKRLLGQFVARAGWAWGGLFVAYPLAVAAAPEFWLRALYGEKYAGEGPVLVAWAAMYAVIGLSALPWHIVNVLRRPELGFWAALGAGLVGVALAAAWSPTAGPSGAVAGRLIGEIGLLGAGIWALARLLPERRSEA